MSKSIKPDQLAEALQNELTIYSQEVTKGVNDKGREAMKKLVSLTKASAPTGRRGRFKKSIAMQEETTGNGSKRFIWYVKAPEHRLTHLLVHGHAKKDGGRTKANPFLKNALDTVLPEYEQAVEEVIQNDK